jgi:hypothetical protein
MNISSPENPSKKQLEILPGQEPLITRSELNTEIAKKEEEVAEVERKLREGYNGVALTEDEREQLEQKLASRIQDLEGLKMIEPQEDKVINLEDVPHTVDSDGNMEFDEDSLTPEQLDIVFQALKENNYEESGGVVGTKEEVLADNQSQNTSEPLTSTEDKVNVLVDPINSLTEKDPESIIPVITESENKDTVQSQQGKESNNEEVVTQKNETVSDVDMSYVEMATGVPYDSHLDSGSNIEKNVDNDMVAADAAGETASKKQTEEMKQESEVKKKKAEWEINGPVEDWGHDEGFVRPFEHIITPRVEDLAKKVEAGLPLSYIEKRIYEHDSNLENLDTAKLAQVVPPAEIKERMTEEQYNEKLKKQKQIHDSMEKAVTEHERIVQKHRSGIFWRIKNLGFKNVMTDFKIKSRNFFSKLFSFGKKDVVANGVANVRTQETVIPEEYITKPGDNLSDIIKNQILSVPELANLTQKQKDAVVENLFSYAKLNVNMSMFDQVNKFSDKGVIDSGSNIDLHMLKRLISFPVDYFKNKTIIEYSKEVTKE